MGGVEVGRGTVVGVEVARGMVGGVVVAAFTQAEYTLAIEGAKVLLTVA